MICWDVNKVLRREDIAELERFEAEQQAINREMQAAPQIPCGWGAPACERSQVSRGILAGLIVGACVWGLAGLAIWAAWRLS